MAQTLFAKAITSLLCLLLPALLLCLGGCQPEQVFHKQAPTARQGVLDLSGWDLEQDGPLALGGEWDIYWQQLLTPEDFRNGASPPVPFASPAHPGDRDDAQFGSEQPGSSGFATYRLRILPGAANTEMVLDVSALQSAFRVWVNGKLLVEAGRVGKTASEEIPGSALRRPRLARSDQPVDLLVQISHQHVFGGGLAVGAVRLGLEPDLAERPKQFDMDLVYIGSFFAIGIYHLALFSFRRKDRAPLYFGLYCLLWMGNTLFSDCFSLAAGFFSSFCRYPSCNVYWVLVLGQICFVLSVPVIYSFFRTLFPREFSSALQGITWVVGLAVAGCYLVFARVFPLWDRTLILQVYYPLTMALILYALVRLIKARRNGREGATLMVSGMIILGLAGVNDMLRDWVSIPVPYLVSVALVGFILLQAAALSLRFSKAFTTVEQLSAEREEHIDSLSRLDRLKDEFLANTSHELRTPLNGIIGLAESLGLGAAGPLSESARAHLELIAGSGRRLSHLVNDILDHSRLKSKDIELHRKPVDLRAITDKVLAITEPLVRARPLRLVNAIPAGFHLVEGDEDRLQQILFNLVGNAVKFTDQGEVVVSATHGNPKVEVTVRDTGIGIPPEKLESIFNAFEQVDGTAARSQGGVGLGLGISRHLVELHGGRLWAESTPGGGSSFRFTLRPSAEAVLPEAVAASAHAGLQVPILQGLVSDSCFASVACDPGAPRILAVDDDPVNLQVVRNHLGLEGMAVTLAANGHQALALIEAGEVFDLVLLDVMMPGMTGFEVCRGIRRRYNAAELPVLMLTAKNRLTDLTEGLNSGANDYLGKPFAREELLARAQAQLKVRKAHEMTLENSRLRSEIERRAQTELELRLGQRRLDGMLHALPEPIVAVNESCEIAFCNRIFEERFGYCAAELLGQSVRRLLGPSAGSLETWLCALDAPEASLPAAGELLEMFAADGRPWSGRVVPAVLELENERLLVLLLGEAAAVTTSVHWIDDLSHNRQRLQKLEETLNGLTPLVLEKHPGFIDDLRAVDRSLERMSWKLSPECPEQDQRQLIVKTMNLALDLWTEATQTTKADLARQSRQWAVYVNQDGWERTQTLDRYLSLPTLPAKPRLKKVLLTGEFVLANAPVNSALRQRLESALERLREQN